jgi:hypothetical protein
MEEYHMIINIESVFHLGASTVKWTTLDCCTHSSESGSKQYTNNIFEKNHKNHKILKTY